MNTAKTLIETSMANRTMVTVAHDANLARDLAAESNHTVKSKRHVDYRLVDSDESTPNREWFVRMTCV